MTSVQVPDIMQRARRTARRLLAGSGSAAVTAYRIDPSAPAAFVAHALRADGRILVAACPPQGTPLAIAPDDVAVDIRLDVTLDAAEPGVRITAATAHLLGSLTWVEGEDRALLLASSSSIMMTLTHYATGTSPVIFGSGYTTLGEWWKAGFIMSVVNLVVFVVIGGVWWKVMGYW